MLHSVNAILEAIHQLTPTQRRQLQKRLRVAGLLLPDTLTTDHNRLAVAPALGVKANVSAPVSRPLPPTSVQRPPPAFAPPITGSTPALPLASAGANSQRSPVSGRVVVGSPEQSSHPLDPHAMRPLPGQAPEQPIEVVFDGGSRGNPGQGYGSYELRWPGSPPQVVKLRFGDQMTNNEAEYDTLIGALEAILKRLQESGAAPNTARVEIRGDSLLVVNQVHGRWQCKEARLQGRRDQVRQQLQRFGHWSLAHHDRANSVRVLGH
jgi:ribonuclease HI